MATGGHTDYRAHSRPPILPLPLLPSAMHRGSSLSLYRLPRSTDEAEKQQGEHDGCDHDIYAVALQHEGNERGGDAGDRSPDEEQQPELHDRGAAKRERAADDAPHSS